MRMLAFALMVPLLLAGCSDGGGGGDGDGSSSPAPTPSWALHGTFAESATQDEMQELGDHVSGRGGDMALLESFPAQFHASGLSQDACGEVWTFAREQDYVQDVGECGPAA